MYVERRSTKMFGYQGTGKDSAPRSWRQKVASENGSRHRANKQKQRERDEENKIAENTNTYLHLSLEVYHTMRIEKPDKDIWLPDYR